MRWEKEQLLWRWAVPSVSLVMLWWFRPWAGPQGQGRGGWLLFIVTVVLCAGLTWEVFRRRPGR
jgi:hypothetical protein